MATIDEVRRQIAALDGARRWLACRETKMLPGLPWADERRGTAGAGTDNGGSGLPVATNKGLIHRIGVEGFPCDEISSIEYRTGILFGAITNHASGKRARIEQVDKRQAAGFSAFVRARTTPVLHHPARHGAGAVPAGDVVSNRGRLADLTAAGILTDQEFADQKCRVLAG